MLALWYEVVHIRPDPRLPRFEMVQVKADPNPMPHVRLFRWGRRRA